MKTCKTISLTLLATQVCLLTQGIVPALATSQGANQYLDMDLAQLMQVTITSVSKKPQALADAAAAVFVITQEDIRRSGATSIPEALAMAPGLQVAQISAGKWSIASRGFGGYTSNKLLVMLDGRSVYTPAYSGTFWDMQNTLLEDIDRIEVIRGPGGTIWGANAVNGVINIITKKAQDTQGTLVRASVGNQEQSSTGARHGAKIGESAFGRLYVTTSDYASNLLADSGQDGNDGWQNYQGGFRMDGQLGSQNQWTLQGDLFKNDGDQIVFPYWVETPPYLRADSSGYTATGTNLIGKWQHQRTGGDLVTLNAYYDANKREESNYEQTFTTIDLNLQYETLLGQRNSLTLGAGYRQIEGDFAKTYQVEIPDQHNALYSAFLQDEIKLVADRLWLTLGTKYEHNEFTGSEWQPSARLLWKPAIDHSLWTAVARAVRTPSMIENNGAVTVAVFPTPWGTQKSSVRGDANFGSESLVAYEAGYRWQARKNLSVDLAAYHNDYDDLYVTIPGSNPYSFDQFFTNARQGHGEGVEVAVNWKTNAWLSLIFTYSWQELELRFADGLDPTGTLLGEDPSSADTPKHQASVRSAIDLTEHWQFNGWLRYVDAIKGRNVADSTKPLPIDAYVLLDANLIWKPQKDLEVMFAGQNLLNSRQLEYISELVTLPTEIERGFFAKVTWKF